MSEHLTKVFEGETNPQGRPTIELEFDRRVVFAGNAATEFSELLSRGYNPYTGAMPERTQLPLSLRGYRGS